MNEFEAWQKIIEKWKEVDRMKTLNQRLYDELGSAILYILDFSKRNNIILHNRDRLFKLVENIHDTVDSVKDYHNRINGYNLPTESQQRNKTTDDETEPINIKYYNYFNRIYKLCYYLINFLYKVNFIAKEILFKPIIAVF